MTRREDEKGILERPRVGFAYRRPDRHPVLDDGIGLKGGPGTVLDGSSTDPVPDDGVGTGIGRYRYRMTVFLSSNPQFSASLT